MIHEYIATFKITETIEIDDEQVAEYFHIVPEEVIEDQRIEFVKVIIDSDGYTCNLSNLMELTNIK